MEILSCIVGGNTIALLKELKDFDMLTVLLWPYGLRNIKCFHDMTLIGI